MSHARRRQHEQTSTRRLQAAILAAKNRQLALAQIATPATATATAIVASASQRRGSGRRPSEVERATAAAAAAVETRRGSSSGGSSSARRRSRLEQTLVDRGFGSQLQELAAHNDDSANRRRLSAAAEVPGEARRAQLNSTIRRQSRIRNEMGTVPLEHEVAFGAGGGRTQFIKL